MNPDETTADIGWSSGDPVADRRGLAFHLLVLAALLGWPFLLRGLWVLPSLVAYFAGLVWLVWLTGWSRIEKSVALLIPVGIVYAMMTWTASWGVDPPAAYAGSPRADRMQATLAGAGVVVVTLWLGWRSFVLSSSSKRAGPS